MKIRQKDYHNLNGDADRFNTNAVSPIEIIVNFGDGGADSVYARDYEVELSDGRWVPIIEALGRHLLITDDYYTRFFEPQTDEDRERGYTL